MTETVSLSEAGRRLAVPKQTMSVWRRAPGFPPVTRRGRALVVEWEAIERWVADRNRDRDLADDLVAESREFRRLRAILWNRARWMFSPEDLSFMLADVDTIPKLRRRARQFGIDL